MAARKLGSDRRMGPRGSENWHAMLDGAEDILREEGHAQLSSRCIAERIGVKQRLVYYYFHTMDELIVEMFRRSSERDLQRLREISDTAQPLHQIWEICVHSHDARLISEYMALANRIPDLRTEVIKFIEESREMQVKAISKALARSSLKSRIPASGLALLAASIGLTINREEQLGVSVGHDAIMTFLNEFLSELED